MLTRRGTRTVLFTTSALIVAYAAVFGQQDDTNWRNAMQEAAKARQSGQLQEVEKLLKGALAEAEKFGPVDQRVVLSLDALGTYYYTQGIYGEAVPVYERLMGIRQRTLGANHPAVASALNDLAMIESIQGKHAEAQATSEKALQIAERAARESGPVYSLGSLVHNRRVVARLQALGVVPVPDLAQVKGKRVLIPSHGVGPEVLDPARRDFQVTDATCPLVARAQQRAREMAGAGLYVIVFGESHHPEVQGLLAWAGAKSMPALSFSELLQSLPRRLDSLP
mgnify:CR=1 FL=1